MDQYVGHSEIAEAPGEGGENGECAVFSGLGSLNIGVCEEVQVAGNGLCIGDNGIPAAGGVNAEDQDDNQGKGHYQALNEAGNRGRHEAAHGAVGHNDNG